ncbi:M15 family metallopeptidase [Bacillus sp. FJAT-49736]|uniref:M15 family metallopeptidase n=1 Tax=Bacillus sp. FJAT-49736 TaxID=2833582 RepID=UPI001BC98131|nr:M15 family metallopeptidase [Bacillus sp. FJAT-49736]MBS4174587.1 M15 family metallopeptidase [Bacillus sp. FJAT-49736]
MKRVLIFLICGILYILGCGSESIAAEGIKSTHIITVSSKKPNEGTFETNAIHTVANPASITVMVNKTNALPKGYRPKDLVRAKVKFFFGNQQVDKAKLRKPAAQALEKMFKAAAAHKIILYGASGFRSYETQAALFKREVVQYGRKKAEMAVALPGTSEHQTGLAMDITAKSIQYHTAQKFAKTKEGIWLAKHAHEYGFILRYPKGKENITKYEFEPWHFRYVGVKTATAIYKKHITLEEYNKRGV